MPSIDLSRMIARLDGELVVALEEAVALAVRYSHPSVEIEHWFVALGETDGFVRVVEAAGADAGALGEQARQALERLQRGHGEAPSISTGVIDLAREAWVYASLQHGRPTLDILDLLYAALGEPSMRALLLGPMPALRDVGLGALERMIGERAPAAAPVAGGTGGGAAPASASTGEFLESYTLDLTEQARSGALDPIVGRDEEMRQIIDILVRRRQNNPILVGEAGVGKTAAVEAFALEVAAGNVPDVLKDIRLLALDLTLLQAGAGVKGEFERRLTGVIEEVKASAEPIILFIDEAHTMIGAGGQAGQGDAANILKPALARGELRTIAATTWAEYKKFFEKDAALTRRFQTVQIDEPDEGNAVRMLRSLVTTLESHHGVRIRDEAVHAAVGLSMRYIQARQLPDKAVSLLDTACAAVSISRATVPARIQDAERAIELLELERQRLDAEPDRNAVAERITSIDTQLTEERETVERLTARLDEERELVASADEAESGEDGQATVLELEERLRDLQGEEPLVHRVVDRETVAAVVARWTGIPLGRLMRDRVETVRTLEDRLGKRVVGQDFALKSLSDAIVTAHADLGDDRRPPGVFLMVGTSGVGKTETALALATLLYGGETNLTVINMSEFKEEHKVSLLLGSPPGYVGYGEGGVLTEAVRRKPYGALLLDEIDKAHPGVQDIFYQVFDKGMLKDGEGRDIDFKNTVIMMTANTGTKTLQALAADPDTMPEADQLADLLQPELLETFKPAFLGRVSVVPYLPLSPDVLRKIVDIQIEKIRKRVARRHDAPVEVTEAAIDALVARSSVVETGARAIEATIAKSIMPSLSRQILELTLGEETVGGVTIDVGEDERFSVGVVKA